MYRMNPELDAYPFNRYDAHLRQEPEEEDDDEEEGDEEEDGDDEDTQTDDGYSE